MNKDKYWGFCENKTYKVGCTGGSVYIFDNQWNQLKRFQDEKYAYDAKFKPNSNIVVVKTTEGCLLIYDLDELKLLKKIVITRMGCEDEGFDFSPDGKWFYNIEKPKSNSYSRLTKYNTTDFSVEKIVNENNKHVALKSIEVDKKTGKCYLLGFTRKDNFSYEQGFVAELVGDRIEIRKEIDFKTCYYVGLYKAWEDSGFTKKSFDSILAYEKVIKPVTLKDIAENEWILD